MFLKQLSVYTNEHRANKNFRVMLFRAISSDYSNLKQLSRQFIEKSI